MRKSLKLLLCLVLTSTNLIAQISEGGKPHSFNFNNLKSSLSLPTVTLKTMDTVLLLAEDQLKPVPFRYAVFEDTLINLKTAGKSDLIPGKGRIWRLRIYSSQAKSMQIIFSKYKLPAGASVFTYTENHTQVNGAFTRKNMHKDSTFILADFPGNSMIVEYFEPENPEFNGEIIIGSLSQAYKEFLDTKSYDYYLNINCPAGKDAQLEKHAACKITFNSGSYSYKCSGSLINNARNDGTPYFLTAHHCISQSDEASTLVAYFNYENAGCEGPEMTPVTLTGSSLLTTADSSDYTLLLLNSTPPDYAQPYYAGWDVNDIATQYVYSIHHPMGLSKKIAIDYDTIFSNPDEMTWEGGGPPSPPFSHWVVDFDNGITDRGSSGSPLFNRQKQIIGQLHGSYENFDFFGKLSFSWNNKPAGYPLMSDFLDPDHTGISKLDGYSPATNPPDAFFTVPTYQVCLNAPVVLEDYSVFGPYERNWVITPSTYIFTDGTSKVSARPVVEFESAGIYTVSLTISNAAGADSMRLLNAALAGNTIDVSVNSNPADEICQCDFKQLQFVASGADTYSWNIVPKDTNKVEFITVSMDSALIRPVSGFAPDSGYIFNIETVGIHGTCVDTVHTSYKVLKPANDEIINAILLSYGKSNLFTNICATIEPGEPIPPYTSCTSQLSWCDEYGTGLDIVEHSVWFRFIAPPSGKIKVYSTGMDNEIALYEADSESDILNDNYELKGANDDRTDTDFTPSIRSATVHPGKTYWLQVDGSAGGLEDDFYIHLYELVVSGTEELKDQPVITYPQPASQFVFLKGDALSQFTQIRLDVFNSSGTLVYQANQPVEGSMAVLDVSGWESGVYFVRILAGNDVYSTRILKL